MCKNIDFKNDSYVMYYPDDNDCDDEECNGDNYYDEEYGALKKLLNSTFNITEPILLHISW
jgi:hypothetical protein